MNKFEFISSLIGSLAWPIVILIIVIILRQPIVKILSSISKVTFNNIEMDFERKLNEIESSLEDNKEQLVKENQESNKQEEQIKQIAEISPSASITMSWSMLEQEIQSTIQRLAISPDFPLNNSALKNINLLKQEKILDSQTLGTLNELRNLRNIAVHDHLSDNKISYLDAIKYYELSLKIVRILKDLQK